MFFVILVLVIFWLLILSHIDSYFTNVVQLLCSLSGWLHLSCSSIGTGFDGAETNCKIADNIGILLKNSNCFAIFFQQHSSYVCSDIYLPFCSKIRGDFSFFIMQKVVSSPLAYICHFRHCTKTIAYLFKWFCFRLGAAAAISRHEETFPTLLHR